MFNIKTLISAAALTAALVAVPAVAQEADTHATPHIERQDWSFAGIFGTYDQNQLQRGFQVFREVCANCHSANLLAFRNLAEPGGPHFSEEQVKALAAEYEVADAAAEGGVRPAVPADRWPSPFANDQEAREANGGSVPPDFSVLAKARGVSDPFPTWIFNYFTAYAEGGPDYIHALLNGYREPPEGFELPEGKYYNEYFPGHAIGMSPPLSDDQITYEPGENGETVPQTVEQYSQDVSAFMMWLAEPGLVARKQTGFVVLLYLFAFAGLLWFTKKRIWKSVEH
ncbi:MAG: cytochrome c1 [Devosia sp.]|jgi:ubiquinol-cytochrome c reductase cytochrome c1 subunit|nr:cytochrome c1 [Devosia sp.]